jgi:hypothetical protein
VIVVVMLHHSPLLSLRTKCCASSYRSKVTTSSFHVNVVFIILTCHLQQSRGRIAAGPQQPRIVSRALLLLTHCNYWIPLHFLSVIIRVARGSVVPNTDGLQIQREAQGFACKGD